MDLNNYKRSDGSTSNEPVSKDSAAQAKPKSPSDPKAVPASESFTKDSAPQKRPEGRAFDLETDTEVSSHPSTGGEADRGNHESERASKMSSQPAAIRARKDDVASDK